jgi:hypothetical protein
VDGITGREDQKRDEKISAEARAAIDENCLAWVRKVTGNPAVTVSPLAQERVYEISDLVWSLAYRAGREDLLRSGSCPECAAGDPHNEPDKPHIHLTTYGYLLYAPDHEQLDFVREIREIERRAGREDAARDLRKIAVSSDKGNILRDLLDFAADVTEGKYTAAQVSLAAKVAAGDRTDDLDGDGVQPTEDAARNALIIIGELDITTVVAALDRAGFDCPDDALGNASADLLQRLPVWQGSDGRYRPRIPKVDQPGVQPAEDGIDEQWSVWLTVPGGITVVTLADEQDDEPLNALGDVRRYDSDEEWARDYAANPPEGTLKAQVRRRTRTHWSAWQPVDQSGVQPTEEQRARSEDQNRDEEQR